MDRLESMSVLIAAVEAGSLSAASRKLGMPLATVSRKVSELEASELHHHPLFFVVPIEKSVETHEGEVVVMH